jgi:hypothetical protein
MAYTSDQHLAVKMVTFFAWAGAWIALGYVLHRITSPLLALSKKYDELVPYGIAFLIVSGILAYLFHKHDPWFDAVGAYFYIRQDSGTTLSFAEAKALSFLFVGDADGKWYPLTEVKKLPKEKRKQYLFDFAAQIAERIRSGKIIT